MLNKLYSLFRPLLFQIDEETAHKICLHSINIVSKLSLSKLFIPHKSEKIYKIMGLNFNNPVGLAAGMDKDGIALDGLGSLGFGFIELGTTTPLAQSGNSRPRLFRIKQHNAIINRMGFNNVGIDNLIKNIKKTKYKGIIGINISKNSNTPNKYAINDYIYCFKKAYLYADYIAINISSPNTKNLRELQNPKILNLLLSTIKKEQIKLTKIHNKFVPIAVKISPDLNYNQIKVISNLLLRNKINGIIATNTTISRFNIKELINEKGGLSGKPILDISNNVIKMFKKELGNSIPIIGVGGIFCAEDAKSKIIAGASLVQIYTGLVYNGPKLILECIEKLTKHFDKINNYTN